MQSTLREVHGDQFFKGTQQAAAATVTATGRLSKSSNTQCTEIFWKMLIIYSSYLNWLIFFFFLLFNLVQQAQHWTTLGVLRWVEISLEKLRCGTPSKQLRNLTDFRCCEVPQEMFWWWMPKDDAVATHRPCGWLKPAACSKPQRRRWWGSFPGEHGSLLRVSCSLLCY